MKSIFFLLLISFLNFSCGTSSIDPSDYISPVNAEDRLEVGTLEEVNIDTKLILNAAAKIDQGSFEEVHSMLIFKNDKLVFEEYFQGHLYQ